MRSRTGNWTRRLAVLALGGSLLTACATPIADGCPPVPEYDAAFRDRLADEIMALPDGTATEVALTDYFVMRDQAGACR